MKASFRESTPNSLYERLGGYEVIHDLLDHISARMMKDAALAVYFKGHNTDSKKRLRQHFIDYVCRSLGGPVYYTGLEMKASHDGLEITATHWDVFWQHVMDVLEMHKIPAAERQELCDVMQESRVEIVAPPRQD
jgi:hemoglobin